MTSAFNWLVDSNSGGIHHSLLTLVRISLALSFAWIAHFVWRRANPQLRVLLWRTTVGGLVLVFAFGELSVNWNLPVLPTIATRRNDSSPTEAVTSTQETADDVATVARQLEANNVVGIRQPETSESIRSQQGAIKRLGMPMHQEHSDNRSNEQIANPLIGSRTSESKEPTDLPFSPFQIVLSLWFMGVGALSLRWVIGIRRLVLLFRGATTVPGHIEDQAKKIASELGYSGPVDLRCTDKIQSPCNIGAWVPRILIPSRQCEPSAEAERQASLAHEIAHCKHNDLRWNHLLTLLQALLWFHPLAWKMRLAHTDACDEVSDSEAARYVGDQHSYGRLLATIALRIASEQPKSALAMARRSQVRHRIEAIGRNLLQANLGRRTTGLLITVVVAIAAVLGTALPTHSEDADLATDVSFSRIESLHQTAKAINDSVQFAHIRFRKIRISGPFKSNVTSASCVTALAKYDLASQPDDLRKLVAELIDISQLSGDRLARMSMTPWSNMELHYAKDKSGAARIRETRHRRNGASDIHVIDSAVSVRWADANSQMDIDPLQDNRYAYTRLSDFWQPSMTAEKVRDSGARVTDAGGQLVLEANSPNGGLLATIDAESGFLLTMDRTRKNRFYQSSWSNWKTRPSGVTFPSVVARLGFADDQLKTFELSIVEDARFNTPISDSVFRLGIPAGSVVVDRRTKDGERAVKVNRDVFDAVSWQEVGDALKPIEVPLTSTEEDAIAKLTSRYVLSDDELVKRFAPPYPLERKYLPRMLQPKKYYAQRKGPRYDILQWQDGEIVDTYVHTGAAPRVSHLISRLINHPITDVEIPAEVLTRRIRGDFLYRPNADQQAMANALAEILSNEFGQPISLKFQDIEKTVYVASGKLAIDDNTVLRKREGLPLIMVNGGDHPGDHGEVIGSGDTTRFLDELSEYINMKVINRTEHDSTKLSWSMRWYDLKSTPPEKRFSMVPAEVVELIESQMGIQFSEQKQVVRILRLEK